MLHILIAAVLPIPSLAHIGTLNSKLRGELEIITSTEFDHVEDRASNEGSRRFHNHMPVKHLLMSVFNVKVGAIDQEKTQIGDFSVIVKTSGTLFEALV